MASNQILTTKDAPTGHVISSKVPTVVTTASNQVPTIKDALPEHVASGKVPTIVKILSDQAECHGAVDLPKLTKSRPDPRPRTGREQARTHTKECKPYRLHHTPGDEEREVATALAKEACERYLSLLEKVERGEMEFTTPKGAVLPTI